MMFRMTTRVSKDEIDIPRVVMDEQQYNICHVYLKFNFSLSITIRISVYT